MVTIVDTISDSPLRPRHPEKVNRQEQVSPPKPNWIRVKAPTSRGYADTRSIVRENKLVTVCEEAGCPNIGECWDKKHATFMIMGDTCTRACAFCNVKTGMPGALDADEPANVAEATFKLGLAHIVVTSVDRDDLADGGAAHIAATIRAIREKCPTTTIEVRGGGRTQGQVPGGLGAAAGRGVVSSSNHLLPSSSLRGATRRSDPESFVWF